MNGLQLSLRLSIVLLQIGLNKFPFCGELCSIVPEVGRGGGKKSDARSGVGGPGRAGAPRPGTPSVRRAERGPGETKEARPDLPGEAGEGLGQVGEGVRAAWGRNRRGGGRGPWEAVEGVCGRLGEGPGRPRGRDLFGGGVGLGGGQREIYTGRPWGGVWGGSRQAEGRIQTRSGERQTEETDLVDLDGFRVTPGLVPASPWPA